MTFNSHRRSEAPESPPLVGQKFLMLLLHVLNMAQPIIAQAKPIAPKRRPHAAAPVMSADDDVAHFQDIDRKLHDRQTIQVGVHDQVRDIPMDEQFSGRQADNLIGGNAAVGTADPEIAGELLLGELEEKIRVLFPDAAGPGFVVFQELAEITHRSKPTRQASLSSMAAAAITARRP